MFKEKEMTIANLVLEQGKKAYPTLTHDHDYNVLIRIVKLCCAKNWDPIEGLMNNLKDKKLAKKVKAWMEAGSPAEELVGV